MIAVLAGVLGLNAYTTLGLEAGATAAQIRAAFRKKARVLHPDAGGDEKLFRELVAAVETLQDSNAFASSNPISDSPPGLTPLERVAWLTSNNKVALFMRGTKQQPQCDCSDACVATLSAVAFDTNNRFAAFNIDAQSGGDPKLGAAVLQHAGEAFNTLPLCFIGGQCVGGRRAIDELWESGQLHERFGGEQLVAPRELEWQPGSLGGLVEEALEDLQRRRRSFRNPNTGQVRDQSAIHVGRRGCMRTSTSTRAAMRAQPRFLTPPCVSLRVFTFSLSGTFNSMTAAGASSGLFGTLPRSSIITSRSRRTSSSRRRWSRKGSSSKRWSSSKSRMFLMMRRIKGRRQARSRARSRAQRATSSKCSPIASNSISTNGRYAGAAWSARLRVRRHREGLSSLGSVGECSTLRICERRPRRSARSSVARIHDSDHELTRAHRRQAPSGSTTHRYDDALLRQGSDGRSRRREKVNTEVASRKKRKAEGRRGGCDQTLRFTGFLSISDVNKKSVSRPEMSPFGCSALAFSLFMRARVLFQSSGLSCPVSHVCRLIGVGSVGAAEKFEGR